MGTQRSGDMTVEIIIDPVADYAALMQTLFDFDALRGLFASGFTMRFDAMHAITGPYAHRILEGMLGAPKGTVINPSPSPDFGGGHPDPNLVYAKPLYDLMMGPDAPDSGAASDGDGDRNLIIGKKRFVTPCRLIGAARRQCASRAGLCQWPRIARSMPTSAAADRVAEKLGIEMHETPTGWKFFGNLLDAGRVTICGEESARAPAPTMCGEKDGLWAVLLWPTFSRRDGRASTRSCATSRIYGRNYYTRHDYDEVDAGKANKLMDDLRARLPALATESFDGLKVSFADDFSYLDPVDQSVSSKQGIRIGFSDGSRTAFRLSGTGTVGATLRVCIERYEPPHGQHELETQAALSFLIGLADRLAGISRTDRPGRSQRHHLT